MLLTVLSLRLTTTWHQLQRDWWRVLFLVGGVIWAFALVPPILFAARILGYNDAQTKVEALVLVAGVLLLGWVVVPLLVTGLDDSLEPGRFAALGIEPKRLAPSLGVATLLTVPSMFFAFVLVALATAWRSEHPKPWVSVVAVAGALLTWAAMILSARIAAAWSARVLGSRRAREAALITAVSVAALAVPAVWVIVRDGLELVLEYDLRVLMGQLAVTPVGAGMAAPQFVVDREPWGAAWRLAMMVVWVVILAVAWRATVAHSLVNPVFRGGGTRTRDDSILAAADKAKTTRPRTAVKARLLRYWFTDPRYLSNLIGVLVMPILLVGLAVPTLGLDARWTFLAPVLLAATIGWGRHNDVALDSSALWIDVTGGQLGAEVMRGRMAAVLTWAIPGVGALAIGALAWTRLWELAPALIGACIGVLGSTLGVAAITSIAFPYRAPAPGESPFGAEVGSVGASLVAQFVSSAVTFVVLPLSVVPFVLAFAVDPRWGWVSAIVGTAVGVLVYLLGVRVGGLLYDRRAGALIGLVT